MKQTKIACTLAAALTLGCLALPYGGSVSAEEADDAVAIAETAESSAVDSSEDSLISEDDLNSEESAETFTSGDYTYTLTTQGTVCLTKYSGSDTELVIPDQLDGKDVTELGGGIFAGKSSITAITLPKKLDTINDSCFYGCASLETFQVPAENTAFTVNNGILFSADGTDLICYPPAYTQTSYVIPDGVAEIWSSAFANTKLTAVTFPDGLLYIDDWAFSYAALESLELPDSLLEIGQDAFAYCEGLTDVAFPSSLELIEVEAFAACENLTNISLPDGLQTVQMSAFAGTGLKEVTIPSSVQEIGFAAFGYEVDTVTPVEDFVIYGEVGSQAQSYCTASDEENNYENHFTFRSVMSESVDEPEKTVQVEKKEQSAFQKYGKWILIGVGILIVLAAGILLMISGGRGKKKASAEKKAETEKTEKSAEKDTADSTADKDAE